ncbi:hypothetical protein [Acidisphaera sp. S103]|uniref:hypothetical protein n=1 Tax=Acidisphaera sp. S103 TaxID=1747223 RepID=UPI00131CFD35|nr:hypothetical protein [Acidisphaera sp. S103]
MTKIIAALTVLTFVLGPAAYADASMADSPVSVSTSVMPNTRGNIAASNPNVPGATGSTIVRGNTSTISEDAKATRQQQTGAYGG